MVRPKTIENRAEQIVSAADELFARYGYERTSIDDIAKHLDIGKGSIYLDFKTKQDILMEILHRHAENILNVFEERFNNIKGSPLQALQNAIEESALLVYDKVSSDFHTPEALLHNSLELKRNEKCQKFLGRKLELIVGFLKKATEAGEIDESIANYKTALTLKMGLTSLFPPYLPNYSEPNAPFTRQTLQENAKSLLSILMNGLRLQKS